MNNVGSSSPVNNHYALSLTLGGGHAMQYADNVPQKCMLETYVTLLTSVTPIRLITNKEMSKINCLFSVLQALFTSCLH